MQPLILMTLIVPNVMVGATAKRLKCGAQIYKLKCVVLTVEFVAKRLMLKHNLLIIMLHL